MSDNPLIHCFSFRPSVMLSAQFCSYLSRARNVGPPTGTGTEWELNDDRTNV